MRSRRDVAFVLGHRGYSDEPMTEVRITLQLVAERKEGRIANIPRG